jgi:uncharacterized protein with FMN-binding domain
VRRLLTWILSTVAVLVLLFSYRTSTSGPTATAAPSSAVAPAPAATGSTGQTFTGAAAATEWGDVQVAITVANGKITNVTVPQYPHGNRRDQQINTRALPTLTSETLSAHSADIDMVSGATVTSTGYVQSLQSALDQAGL